MLFIRVDHRRHHLRFVNAVRDRHGDVVSDSSASERAVGSRVNCLHGEVQQVVQHTRLVFVVVVSEA